MQKWGVMGKIGIKQLPNNNRMVSTVKSGSKGSDINIAQMICVWTTKCRW